MIAIRAGLVLFWAAVVLLVLAAGPADSPLRAGYTTRREMIAFFPQGWAFFTRDPREPVDRAYRPGAPPTPLLYTNSSARSLFGLSRGARALNVEIAALLMQAPSGAWHECRDSLSQCLATSPDTGVPVANQSMTRQLCGPVVVERQPPVPWAWGRALATIHMPSKFLRLDVRCDPKG